MAAISSANQDHYLASGIYNIESAAQDGAFLAPQTLLDVSGIVIAEESLAFKWEVLRDDSKQRYTIQIEHGMGYAMTPKDIVFIGKSPQLYSIRVAKVTDDKAYYEILTSDGRRFKYNGNDKAVTAVKHRSDEIDFLWLFNKPDDTTLSENPYSVYSENFKYFEYEGIKEDHPLLDRFGLKDGSDDRWPKFWAMIDKLNNDAHGKVLYKVIFLGRHGQATNNLDNKAGDLPIRDAPLTQIGYIQASNVQAMWTKENSLKKGGIGIPRISYCSPLMRCLATNSITFAPQLGAEGGPTIHTVVYEDCREQVSKNETEHRLPKGAIAQMFPDFSLEPNFSDNDPLWAENESKSSVELRAEHILDRIFKIESKEKHFVSITAHSGINSAIMAVLGLDHRSFKIFNGSVIPLICQYTLPVDENALPDGRYKIRYVPQPSLYADGVKYGEPVIASERNNPLFPSTWRVKSLDTDKKIYTIQLIRKQLHGMPKPPAYWNTDKQETFVILDVKHAWRLIPSGKAGEYYIELAKDQPLGMIPETLALVTVEKRDVGPDRDRVDKPLVLKSEKHIGPDSPRWRFDPVRFPLALCTLYLKDVLLD